MTDATYPSNIKNFGEDAIDGEYIMASHLNDLRAEVTAIEQALGANLTNTLSAAAFPAKGSLLAGTAAGAFSSLAAGTTGQMLSVDASTATGVVWVTPVDPFLPRVSSQTSSAAPSPNISTSDQYNLTALAVDASFAAPSGSPADGQKLIVRVKDNGSPRSLGWASTYRAIGGALPTTTLAGKTIYLGFIYHAADARWDCIAQAQEA